MKKKKLKTPLVSKAKAIAHLLRLRVAKGLKKARKEVPEAFTPDSHPDPNKEMEILSRALKALPPLARGELEKRLRGDPGQKAVGDTVFVPFIGSAREEAGLDVKTTAYPVERFKKMMEERKEKATCPKCFGNGYMVTRKCVKCNGSGSVPNLEA